MEEKKPNLDIKKLEELEKTLDRLLYNIEKLILLI